MITKEQKQEIVAKYGKDANDTGNFYSSLNTITIMGIMCTSMIPFYLPGHIFMVSNSVNRGVWILYFLYSYDKI